MNRVPDGYREAVTIDHNLPAASVTNELGDEASPNAAARAASTGGRMARRVGRRGLGTACPPAAQLPSIDLADLGIRLIRLAAAVLAREGVVRSIDERWLLRHLVFRDEPNMPVTQATRPRVIPPLL